MVRQNDSICQHPSQHLPIQIECGSAQCKFSRYHPPGCMAPMCTRTCFQYRTYPESYSTFLIFILSDHNRLQLIYTFYIARNLDGVCHSCAAQRR
ncbi:uncharacterized protein SCHCODRAFT_02485815 [Schizophyllum commune H4-8]|uniref:uncharacterized protein n=1 Tax=Schizophyllum commune (strain H4-8 / FGSC 9210) TaxID=578458 RepID=UPI00215EBC60|nr:uncharacterized protein SCHCODRAFT_02485815 [Schizophyllum commune H4-8]KAI5899097.1 hypothetical protein SCHCODRAFT_02485815 [Schizophyllum commune H4-8]